LPSFSRTQAASDGDAACASSITLSIFCILTGETSPVERKAFLEPLIADAARVQFDGHETGDGEFIRKHAG
jgi:hypothetical protein